MVALQSSTRELDRVFDSLCHPSRRRILTLLGDAGPGRADEVTLDAAAAAVDGSDNAAVELAHAHLPKLDGAEYVDWDRDSGTIRRGPRFDDVAPLIELLYDHRAELPAEWD